MLMQFHMNSVDVVNFIMLYGCCRENMKIGMAWKIGYFRCNWRKILFTACKNGHLEIIKFLENDVGLSAKNFRFLDNYACRIACKHNQLEVVEFLWYKVGLNIEDFRSKNNYACRYACDKGHLRIVVFLKDFVGLEFNDFVTEDNFAFRIACNKNHLEIVKFLINQVGLDVKYLEKYKGYVQWNAHNRVYTYLKNVIGL